MSPSRGPLKNSRFFFPVVGDCEHRANFRSLPQCRFISFWKNPQNSLLINCSYDLYSEDRSLVWLLAESGVYRRCVCVCIHESRCQLTSYLGMSPTWSIIGETTLKVPLLKEPFILAGICWVPGLPFSLRLKSCVN